jgi:hypothetical protein
MHRFVWDLTWGSSGGPIADEEAEFHSPSGPKAVPGTYQVRLTVDGQVHTEPLQVVMDPRSSATPEVLLQQLQLGNQIFAETTEARRTLAEINSIQKRISDAQQKPEGQNPELKSAMAQVQSEMTKILTKKNHDPERNAGLQEAYKDLASALRVVERGERAVPSQAIAVYKQSSQQVKVCIREWTTLKQTKLPTLNQQLRERGLSPIAISEIEEEVESLMSR